MKKVIFEGSKEQINNLKFLVKHSDMKLPSIREDYQLNTLWCVEDVKSKFTCTDSEALGLLEDSLTSDNIMSEIWFAIQNIGDEYGLKKVK